VKLKHKVLLAASLPLIFSSVLGAGASRAASCDINASLSLCNQTIGNKTYSNFAFSGFTASPLDTISVGANSVTINFSPDRVVSIPSGLFTYDVALAGGETFNQAQSNITGSTLGITPSNFSTTLNATGLSPAAVANTVTNPSAASSFSSGISFASFSQTFDFTFGAAGGYLSNLGASFTTTTSQSVPGPLPVLGAGAAFGFSRKLRKRIKQSA